MEMSTLFILDANGEPQPVDTHDRDAVVAWALQLEDPIRQLAYDVIGDSQVSTVFLGINTSFGGPPRCFESMVFGGPLDRKQWRYSTRDEALTGHQQLCELVRHPENRNE